MGFSVSVSTAIIFLALFISFGVMYPVMVDGYERVNIAQQDNQNDFLHQQNTDIELDDVVVDDGTTVTVTNTGSVELDVSRVDLVIDNTLIQRSSTLTRVNGDASRELWLPGETLTIETNMDADESVVVIVENGIRVSESVT